MIELTPYHPYFNPIELVFQTLLTRIKSESARYTSLSANTFLEAINSEMEKMETTTLSYFIASTGTIHTELIS